MPERRRKLIYLGVVRLPTEKAHGLQIMQMCEAFADAGCQVELWAARRFNTREMRRIKDIFAHYGVRPRFKIRRLPLIDLFPLAGGSLRVERFLFYVQIISYALMMLLRALFTRADIFYSRDENLLLALSMIKPRQQLAYEPHQMRVSGLGRWVQQRAAARCGAIIPLTQRLADDLAATGADPARMQSAHDGVRAERFKDLPDRASARRQLGWPEDGYIIGYVGRLETLQMDKGVGLLVRALVPVEGAYIALVGGPEDRAATLADQWRDFGLPTERFLYTGQVAPDTVPLIMRALDVGTLTSPWTPQFAYYTSPLKVFEYMAAGCTLVASDLPSIREVVTPEVHALLFPPSDTEALTTALVRLRDDPALRHRLAAAAHQHVMGHFTWAARAESILAHIHSCKNIEADHAHPAAE